MATDTAPRVCPGCGCSADDACEVERPGGARSFCWWVEKADGTVVCSACAFGRLVRRSVADHRVPAVTVFVVDREWDHQEEATPPPG